MDDVIFGTKIILINKIVYWIPRIMKFMVVTMGSFCMKQQTFPLICLSKITLFVLICKFKLTGFLEGTEICCS